MRSGSLLLLLVLGFMLPGCGLLNQGSSWDPFRPSSERQLTVYVNNLHTRDAAVILVAPGRRVRLGSVPGRSTEIFFAPWSQVQEVRFQVEPVGARRHTTQGATVGPGERIELVIQNPAQHSFIRR
jgi:hypothetical protein